MRKNRFLSLISFARGSRLMFAFALGSTVLAAVFNLLDPLILRAAIDFVFGGKPLDAPLWIVGLVESMGGREFFLANIWLLGLALVLTNATGGLFLFIRGTLSSRAAEKTAQALRDRLYAHIQALPYGYHVKADTGDLIQRTTSDVETVRRFLNVQFVEMGRAVSMFAISAAVMLGLDLRMGLFSMSLVPAVLAFSFLYFGKIQKVFLVVEEAESRMTSVLQENLSGIRVVRAFAREEFEMGRFDAKSSGYAEVNMGLVKLFGWYWGVSSVICLAQLAAVLIAGGYWAAKGAFSLGTMVVFFSYTWRLLWPVREMGRILTELGKTMVSVKRLCEILDAKPEFRDDGEEKPEIRGHIRFKNVGLRYDSGKPVLQGIDLEVKAGETIAILGKTGSGKSSLVHLLVRLYEPSEGTIELDGIDLRRISKRHLRENVSIILQEPFLFSKTLKENLVIARPEVPQDELEEAIRASALHGVLADFEKGWETQVGEEGVALSGGQRQRVAIARTLLKAGPILIMDDSMSAVDTETDARIRAALDERRRDRTTFVIAHRISTLAEADRIVVLDEGRIVQQGRHEDLIREKGLYKRVWELQSELDADLIRDGAGKAAPDGEPSGNGRPGSAKIAG